MGYRWYDKENKEPLFPFGHGLSYSDFQYSNLSITENGENFDVSFTVKNISDHTGTETPQLYLGESSNSLIETEKQKLVDFKKVELTAGEQSTVSFTISSRALSVWNTGDSEWDRLLGKRQLNVGSSSRDIRLSKDMDVR